LTSAVNCHSSINLSTKVVEIVMFTGNVYGFFPEMW